MPLNQHNIQMFTKSNSDRNRDKCNVANRTCMYKSWISMKLAHNHQRSLQVDIISSPLCVCFRVRRWCQ